jgi:hypothetical protein
LEVEASDFRKKATGVGTRASLIAISGLIFLLSLIIALTVRKVVEFPCHLRRNII